MRAVTWVNVVARTCPFPTSGVMSGFGSFGLYQTIQKSILSSIRRAP
jgi:hypothetical protein